MIVTFKELQPLCINQEVIIRKEIKIQSINLEREKKISRERSSKIYLWKNNIMNP